MFAYMCVYKSFSTHSDTTFSLFFLQMSPSGDAVRPRPACRTRRRPTRVRSRRYATRPCRPQRPPSRPTSCPSPCRPVTDTPTPASSARRPSPASASSRNTNRWVCNNTNRRVGSNTNSRVGSNTNRRVKSNTNWLGSNMNK